MYEVELRSALVIHMDQWLVAKSLRCVEIEAIPQPYLC